MQNKKSDSYIMYLRKSRADRDFVDEDIMKTLNRHKQRLMDFCKANNIYISESLIFYEIVSADSIAARPEMLKVLQLVETGNYMGVVVVDMDRLCRGDSIDQGIVMNTFKYSNTRIITPLKTYDFSNEFDEEYAEYGLMMGRSEYRKIKRRLWNGRMDAVREGKYVGGNPPYGYETYKLSRQKGYSLRVIPEQADIVQLIYKMYVYGIIDPETGMRREAGSYLIAKTLNDMGYRNQFGKAWTQYHITKILQDETYTGKIVFMRRREKKEVRNGELVTVQVNSSPDKIVAPGLHDAIIKQDLFDTAQTKRARSQIPHLRRAAQMQNPLCTILQCGLCGKNMQLRSSDKTNKRALFCPNVNCNCVGTYIDLVEDRLLKALEQWTVGYQIENQPEDDNTAMLKSLTQSVGKISEEISSAQKQLENVYTFLEQGVYSVDTFKQRSEAIRENIVSMEERRTSSQKEIIRIREYEKAKKDLIPKVQGIIEKYYSFDSAFDKNLMLKEILEKVVYEKTAKGRSHSDEFTIQIYPRIPKL